MKSIKKIWDKLRFVQNSQSENWFEFIGNSEDTKVASLRRILSIFAYFARID